MIPIRTSLDDIDVLLAYLNKQVGWVSFDKMKKSLDAKLLDNRKLAATGFIGLIARDGQNFQITDRGRSYQSDRAKALAESLLSIPLYSDTLSWIHYGQRKAPTAVEIGQYWSSSHDIGEVTGETLKDGAVFFLRLASGTQLGTLKIGRAGKDTRFESNLEAISALLDGEQTIETSEAVPADAADLTELDKGVTAGQRDTEAPATPRRSVAVSTVPVVHVNVEIHIAADATAETVKQIFMNMAKYVLDRPEISDDRE